MTSKKKKSQKKIKAKAGEIYLVESFAGPKVYARIVSVEDEEKGWYSSVLVRQKDIDALRNAAVPYDLDATPKNIKPGTTFKFSIIKKIRGFKPEVNRKIEAILKGDVKDKKKTKRKFRSPKEVLGHVKKAK